jgi:hypothetical protein
LDTLYACLSDPSDQSSDFFRSLELEPQFLQLITQLRQLRINLGQSSQSRSGLPRILSRVVRPETQPLHLVEDERLTPHLLELVSPLAHVVFAPTTTGLWLM